MEGTDFVEGGHHGFVGALRAAGCVGGLYCMLARHLMVKRTKRRGRKLGG